MDGVRPRNVARRRADRPWRLRSRQRLRPVRMGAPQPPRRFGRRHHLLRNDRRVRVRLHSAHRRRIPRLRSLRPVDSLGSANADANLHANPNPNPVPRAATGLARAGATHDAQQRRVAYLRAPARWLACPLGGGRGWRSVAACRRTIRVHQQRWAPRLRPPT